MIEHDDQFGYYVVKSFGKRKYFKAKIIKKTKSFLTLKWGNIGLKFNTKTNREIGIDLGSSRFLVSKEQYDEGIRQNITTLKS